MLYDKEKISRILDADARLVEDALDGYLQLDNPGRTDMQRADGTCPPGISAADNLLNSAMRYGSLGGGKRIRSHLALEFCRYFGGDDAAVMPFACAVEMIHAYSLMHDDLPCMDDDDMRRGKPSSHKIFGEAAALLAGNALAHRAVELAAGNHLVSESIRLEAVLLLSRASGGAGMIGGQVMDMNPAGCGFDDLIVMHGKKTGALIRAAALLGCAAAGVPSDSAKACGAAEYAGAVGLAFQITDDILDVEGETENLGKTIGKDAAAGKITFLSFMSINDARDFAAKTTERGCAALKQAGGGPETEGRLRDLAYWLLDRVK